MEVIAHIVLQWQSTALVNQPILPVALVANDSISDETGQPSANITPDPNAATWGFRGSSTTLDAMEAAGVPVLWSEELADGT